MLRCSAFRINYFFIQFALMCVVGAAQFMVPAENVVDQQMSIKNARAKLLKFIEKETYQLSGFEEIDTVPINYPIDICLMELEDVQYASCLHVEASTSRNQTAFKMFKQIPSSSPLNNYELIFSLRVDDATGMDCATIGATGFVVVVRTIEKNAEDSNDIRRASPIIQVKDGRASVVQYFAMPQQNTAHLQRAGNHMYMLQTFHIDSTDKKLCPIYKWSATTFNEIDALPCTNAMRAEAFILDHEVYVAFANHMDEFNNIETNSVVYKFDLQTRKFNLLQKMKTYGATDVKYFLLNSTHKIEHFLIIANTFATSSQLAANAIIYEFNGEKFIPFQILNFNAPIKQFLPVSSNNGGFVLLVALDHEVTKSFQFDGRSFVEAKIKFTGGSLGRGVSSMRTHQLDHEEIIVVANPEMLRDATNLFRPKYTTKIDRDIGNAITKFDGWYDKVKQKLREDRLDDLFDEIESLRTPIDINVGVLSLQRGHVSTIHTDEVKSAGFTTNKKVMSASMQEADDIIARNVLASAALAKSTQHAYDQLTSASTSMPSTNVIDELIISDKVNVLQTMNGHRIVDLVSTQKDLSLDTLSVDHLHVNDASNLADIRAKLPSIPLRRRRDIASDVLTPLRINQLFVTGRLNGMDFSDLQENVLRTNAVEQQLNAITRIDVVSASAVRVRSNIISSQNLADLVSIKTNSTLIDQDIQFTQPIVANELNIMNRLNHIQVINNRLDALFRRAKGVQTISGRKVFESVTLLEPILQQGKIDIRSPIMAQIKPMANVDRDIELHGDYSISGNMTIENLLVAENLFGRSGRYSVRQLLADALRVDESAVNVAMEFAQPIKVENVVGATSLNNIPVSNLIKRNVDAIQTITGSKLFSGDLHVGGGLCDAYAINGIDLNALNQTVLKKNVDNQVVSGIIHFSRIFADNIRYRSLRFANRPIDHLLTRHTDQVITGNVKIHGNVLVTNNTGVSIRHLLSNSNVFGVALDALLSDSVQHVANEPILLTGNKLINQLYVGHLVVETDFWRTGKPNGPDRSTAAIQSLYKSLRNGIKMEGENIVMANQYIIDQMEVSGTINDMPGATFGQEWLLTERDQTFSAYQWFARVNIEDDVTLSGYINGYYLPTLYYETLWRNTMQHVELGNVAFEKVIVEGSVQLSGQLSGLRLPDDLILRNSTQVQNVNAAFVCEGAVRIYGQLYIEDTLNHHNFSRMCDLISENEFSPYGLVVNGDVTFKSGPSVDYLNGQSFYDLLTVAWFVDDAYVNFDVDDIRFEQVTLQQSITLTGNVNGQDLVDLNARYLSLTKAQQIRTLMHFQNSVHFKRPVTVTSGNVSLYGDLVANESLNGINLTYFRDNVLKQSSGVQIISGAWKFADVTINGNLRSTLINNLNFNNDIVRFSRPEMNIIRASKIFSELRVKNLVCQYGCSVNEVDLGEWIAKAVLVNNNYTIQGTTYLQNPVISHVDVLGTVNNMTFRADQILLKQQRQRIYGNVYIGSQANPLQKLTFESIYLNSLNGHNFTDFHLSLIQRPSITQRRIVANVATNMQFTEPLTIENLECFGQVNGVNFTSLTAINYNRLSEYYRTMIPELRSMADTYVGAVRMKTFDRMVLRQTLRPSEIGKLFKLNRMRSASGNPLYVVLSQEGDTKHVDFYKWNDDEKRLSSAKEYSLDLPNEAIVDLSTVVLDSMELIFVQTRGNGDFTQSFYHYDGTAFYKVYLIEALDRTTIAPAPFTNDGYDCIIFHNHQNAASFDILYVDVNATQGMSHDLQLLKFDTQQTVEMKQLIAGNGEIIVILSIDDVLTIIDYAAASNKHNQTVHNASNVAARTFEHIVFIAVSTTSENRSMHTIEIFRYSTDKLERMQTFEIDGPVVQCQFAHFANNEFLLMVQMTDASVVFYKYYGIAGFRIVQDLKINGPSDPSAAVARPSFSLVEDRRGFLELLAINSGVEVGIIECVFH